MNHKTAILSSIVVSFSSSFVSAIEIPAPKVAAPEKIAELENPAQQADAPVDKTAWLGVAGEPVTDLLKNQLGLESGLALTNVVEGSPANKGGLEKFDIVTKVGEDEINSQDDLRKAIQAKKPGEKIETSFTRNGKQMKQNISLGSRPNHLANPNQGGLGGAGINPAQGIEDLRNKFGAHQGLQGVPEAQIQQFLQGLQGELNQFKGLQGNGIQDRLKLRFDGDILGNGGNMQSFSKKSFSDEEGSVTLESDSKNGKKLTARDPEGNLLFEGPVNTDEDRLLVPDKILEKADKLDTGQDLKGRVQLRIK